MDEKDVEQGRIVLNLEDLKDLKVAYETTNEAAGGCITPAGQYFDCQTTMCPW